MIVSSGGLICMSKSQFEARRRHARSTMSPHGTLPNDVTRGPPDSQLRQAIEAATPRANVKGRRHKARGHPERVRRLRIEIGPVEPLNAKKAVRAAY
jgi:hypothetical protein